MVWTDYLRKRNAPANHDWKSSLGYYFTLFRALDTKSYEKNPLDFSSVFVQILKMNDTEFAFIGLIKLNTERPIQGTNPSFLRFVKYMRMELSSDKLQRVFVTLFGLVKMKRGTHQS